MTTADVHVNLKILCSVLNQIHVKIARIWYIAEHKYYILRLGCFQKKYSWLIQWTNNTVLDVWKKGDDTSTVADISHCETKQQFKHPVKGRLITSDNESKLKAAGIRVKD